MTEIGTAWVTVLSTEGYEVKSRRAWLAPATLTDEEAARCARGPQRPAEWLQARIDGSICVRYGQREFKNRFSTTDGRVIRQFVVDSGTTNARCALCDWKPPQDRLNLRSGSGLEHVKNALKLTVVSTKEGIMRALSKTAHGARPQRGCGTGRESRLRRRRRRRQPLLRSRRPPLHRRHRGGRRLAHRPPYDVDDLDSAASARPIAPKLAAVTTTTGSVVMIRRRRRIDANDADGRGGRAAPTARRSDFDRADRRLGTGQPRRSRIANCGNVRGRQGTDNSAGRRLMSRAVRGAPRGAGWSLENRAQLLVGEASRLWRRSCLARLVQSAGAPPPPRPPPPSPRRRPAVPGPAERRARRPDERIRVGMLVEASRHVCGVPITRRRSDLRNGTAAPLRRATAEKDCRSAALHRCRMSLSGS